MSFTGRINLNNQQYARDPRPIVEGCDCYTCQHFSRGYIRHLLISKEMLSGTLISIHNIHTLEELVRQSRRAILSGTFSRYAEDFLTAYGSN